MSAAPRASAWSAVPGALLCAALACSPVHGVGTDLSDAGGADGGALDGGSCVDVGCPCGQSCGLSASGQIPVCLTLTTCDPSSHCGDFAPGAVCTPLPGGCGSVCAPAADAGAGCATDLGCPCGDYCDQTGTCQALGIACAPGAACGGGRCVSVSTDAGSCDVCLPVSE